MNFSPRSRWQSFRQEVLKSISNYKGSEFILNSKRCIIIAPHPDDEVFGCGGLITANTSLGKKTNILFLTNGDASHSGCCLVDAHLVKKARQLLARKANKLFCIPEENLYFLGENDGTLPRNGQPGFNGLAGRISDFINASSPNAIFCPYPFEGWNDHIAAEELTAAAIRMLPSLTRPLLYYYCVWFWYNMPMSKAFAIKWDHARILDISKYLALKQQAINVYLNERAPCGKPWIGQLPSVFLQAFTWNKELYFEADISNLSKTKK